MRMLSAAALAAIALAQPAAAEVIDKTGVFNGVKVQYRVITPPGYSPAKTYPVILVFTGGAQEWPGVQRTLDEDWKDEAAKRGYILISPAATDGHLYFESGDKIVPAFLEMIRKDYHATKLHVAGHSNGGLSAFHVAVMNPTWFTTVTGYPGLLDPEQMKLAPALKPMCLFMHAGDMDVGWPEAMGGEADALKKMGYRITFVLEKGQGHRLKAKELDLPRRLFDEIESCK
jgi:poly(3-hydroxybutyrate) depolymerase